MKCLDFIRESAYSRLSDPDDLHSNQLICLTSKIKLPPVQTLKAFELVEDSRRQSILTSGRRSQSAKLCPQIIEIEELRILCVYYRKFLVFSTQPMGIFVKTHTTIPGDISLLFSMFNQKLRRMMKFRHNR